MFKIALKIMGTILGCVILGACIVYAIVGIYYGNKFLPGTVINGYQANAMKIDELNDYLTDHEMDYKLDMIYEYGETVSMDGTDIDYSSDYKISLSEIMDSQNPLAWGLYYFKPVNYTAKPEISFDSDKLSDKLDSLPYFHIDEKNQKAKVELVKSDNQFVLVDGLRNVLDNKTAIEKINTSILSGERCVDLREDYMSPVYTAAQEKKINKWETIDNTQDAVIIYKDDDIALRLDSYEYYDWIKVGSNGEPLTDTYGNLLLDDEKLQAFVTKLSETFNTDNAPRKWKTYDGRIKVLPCSWEGYIVDEEKELKAIKSAILSGSKEERKPYYSKLGEGRGNEEVGDTYVEVDLGNQKVFFYDKGELMFTSDCVSGNKRYNYDTPEMVTRIYFMQEGRTLRGENYATFVYYWMAFYNHYGLHDATWRKDFGGDIFMTNGSHGCVNLPKDKAGELYQMVEVGTPVVLYY